MPQPKNAEARWTSSIFAFRGKAGEQIWQLTISERLHQRRVYKYLWQFVVRVNYLYKQEALASDFHLQLTILNEPVRMIYSRLPHHVSFTRPCKSVEALMTSLFNFQIACVKNPLDSFNVLYMGGEGRTNQKILVAVIRREAELSVWIRVAPLYAPMYGWPLFQDGFFFFSKQLRACACIEQVSN